MEEIVKMKIRNLNQNKSPGHDGFHMRVIKELPVEEIASQL